jgi:hypothetical protein
MPPPPFANRSPAHQCQPLASRKEEKACMHATPRRHRAGGRGGACPAVALSALSPPTVSAPHVSFHQRVGGAGQVRAGRQAAGSAEQLAGGWDSELFPGGRLFSPFASAWISNFLVRRGDSSVRASEFESSGRPAVSFDFNAASSVFFTSS